MTNSGYIGDNYHPKPLCTRCAEGSCVSKVNVDYTVQIWKEGHQYVAHAMPLDVMSAGLTPDEARKALDEAVHLPNYDETFYHLSLDYIREPSPPPFSKEEMTWLSQCVRGTVLWHVRSAKNSS